MSVSRFLVLLFVLLLAGAAFGYAAANEASGAQTGKAAQANTTSSGEETTDASGDKVCTCNCGGVYMRINPEPPETCSSVEGDECVNRHGDRSTLEDCDLRYYEVPDKSGNLLTSTP